MNTPSDSATAHRPPPEIVFVPPPPGPVIRPFVFVLYFGILVAVGLFLSIGLVSTGRPTAWVLVPLIVLGVGLYAHLLLRRNSAHAAQRRAFLEKRPPDESDPLVTALAADWKIPGRLPKLEGVRAALEQTRDDKPEFRARILCFGESDVPEVGELHFEPEIVTPTGAGRKRLRRPRTDAGRAGVR